MEKLYIVCYRYANEIEDIRVCINFEIAHDLLKRHHSTHQILEYSVINGVTDEAPIFCYHYRDGILRKQSLLKQRAE